MDEKRQLMAKKSSFKEKTAATNRNGTKIQFGKTLVDMEMRDYDVACRITEKRQAEQDAAEEMEEELRQ